MMIRKLYPRLHLTEAEFIALPECGRFGPVGVRIGTRWKSRFLDGWFIGVWHSAGGYSYEALRRWYQPVIRCARPPALPRCEHCREPVSDDALDTAAWEGSGIVAHHFCPSVSVYIRGERVETSSEATTERIRRAVMAMAGRNG